MESIMKEFRRRMDAVSAKEPGAEPLTNKEEQIYSDMRIVQEGGVLTA